ncbi:hypothetical protein EV356DRAFT_342519 [Viridothelium virens]|uniref:Uncharacterized protein n=1 Tax=Viridothelium virens TaxID=1048519 RepID=A0A6A6GXY8_VIRVR|nr:hypothetical protein EV356DRAFT_342519 [Viridothelium virens]
MASYWTRWMLWVLCLPPFNSRQRRTRNRGRFHSPTGIACPGLTCGDILIHFIINCPRTFVSCSKGLDGDLHINDISSPGTCGGYVVPWCPYRTTLPCLPVPHLSRAFAIFRNLR